MGFSNANFQQSNFKPSSPDAGVMPVHEMTSDQFIREAIAICVHPTMIGGKVHLECAGDRDQIARSKLNGVFRTLAPSGLSDAHSWAQARVERLFERTFSDDVWHSRLSNGVPLVFVKQAVLDDRGIDLKDALRRVHLTQVTDAIRDGLDVPPVVIGEHRMHIEAMSASREVF